MVADEKRRQRRRYGKSMDEEDKKKYLDGSTVFDWEPL
jgi:hypothetical protein